MSEKKRLCELCIYMAFVLILTFLSINSTLVYILALFLVPALVSYLCCISNRFEALLAIAAVIIFSFVTSFVSFSIQTALINLIITTMLIIPGLICAYSFKAKKSFASILFFTCLFDFVLLILALAYSKYYLEINFYTLIREEIILTYEQTLPLIKSLNKDVSYVFEQNEKEIFRLMVKFIPSLTPFFLSTFIIFGNLIKYAFCKISCNSYLIRETMFIDGFDTLRMNAKSNISLAVCILGLVLSTSDNTMMILTNTALSILAVYFVSGLSFIEFKLKQKSVRQGLRLIYMLLIVIVSLILSVFIPVINLIYIIIFVAFLDSLFDFRKLKIKKGE